MSVVRFVIVLLAALISLEGAKLPSYIKSCSLSDPKLSECATQHARDALPFLVKGDNRYKIPNMLPLKIPEIKFSTGDLKIKFTNVKIFGFENFVVKDVSIDVEKNHFSVRVILDRAILLADYNIDGRLLILSIRGQGPANITFVDGKYHYQFNYDLRDINGQQHVHIINHKMDYTTKRSHFRLENLFGEDTVLGNQMNQFLDENWKEVQHDLSPVVTQAISAIITATVSGIIDAVPYNELFLP